MHPIDIDFIPHLVVAGWFSIAVMALAQFL
jgi:hypothetical protein